MYRNSLRDVTALELATLAISITHPRTITPEEGIKLAVEYLHLAFPVIETAHLDAATVKA
jgi:hypothetical protein